MKPIAVLIALAALFAADLPVAAEAKTTHGRPAAHAPPARSHQASRINHRRRARQHLETTALGAQNRTGERTYRAAADGDQDLPSHPGFFRSEQEKEAGWGVKRGSTQAVFGVYQRPERPDIPLPQTIDHEGRGAAGLSLSFKLGQ